MLDITSKSNHISSNTEEEVDNISDSLVVRVKLSHINNHCVLAV
ncbi:MAG: hypothetical protein U9Q66_02105 [Patescibacteria group bacterium]|nr:hypothetical protein [Patescibacteria group bacterium]